MGFLSWSAPFSNVTQVANKKQRDNAAADAEMKARREVLATKEAEAANGDEDAASPTDMLAAGEDEDVIF